MRLVLSLSLFFLWPSDFQGPNGWETCETVNSNGLEKEDSGSLLQGPILPRPDSRYHAPKQPESVSRSKQSHTLQSISEKKERDMEEVFPS